MQDIPRQSHVRQCFFSEHVAYWPHDGLSYRAVSWHGWGLNMKPLIVNVFTIRPKVLCKTAQSAMQNGPKCTAKWAVSRCESAYKKCLREEWGKFTGYQLLSSFWLKVARTDEDRNTTRWDRGTLPIHNLYPKWGMLRFGRIKKVTNWIWMLWFIVSY